MANPRIGVAALNPHGSDGGLLGAEEAEEIAPAVEAARNQGLTPSAPSPPTRFSTRQPRDSTTWSWPCSTTRATYP